VRLAYSVDADDAFMFEALVRGAVDARGVTFAHHRDHTAALNELARREGADVVAVSLGAYPELASRFFILPHGASVGRGFGPVVVARAPLAVSELARLRVAVPGLTTTAFLVLRLIAPDVQPVLVPIAPFARVFQALDDGEVDAALLIHEGRLLYEQRGYHKVVELGVWWQEQTGLPLPLGVNVIRRALGPDLIATVSDVLRHAIAWALANRRLVIDGIARENRGDAALADPALLDRYLGMYANEDTRALAPDVRAAVDRLFAMARDRGLIAGHVTAGWAP
jgi:1,4-dihydroxy-6-naphthoate synthase